MAILVVMGTDLSWAALVGGRLCLDFVNTLGGTRAEGGGNEHLTDYATFVDWAALAGAVDAAQARRLRRFAADHPRSAAEALASAIALREALYFIFYAAMRGDAPLADDLEVLQRHLQRALREPRIVRADGRFTVAFADDGAATAPLDTIARSAVELLASADLGRVRVCSSDGCDWLFVDQTRNGSRRWCEMKACGNRAKARRHYHRTKTAN